MRKMLLAALVCASAGGSPAVAFAQDPVPVESRITSVGLFKNGLAVVRRSVSLPGDGVFELADVPEAVHGTFWIESHARVEALVTTKEVEVPADGRWDGALGADLAGREVTIHFKSGDIAPATGRVAKFEDAKGSRGWSRAFEQPDQSRYWWWHSEPAPPGPVVPASPRFLTLETAKGQVLVDPSMIACLYVTDSATTVKRDRPVLRLTVSESRGGSVAATISYLTKGMGWAPSYRVDLTDSASLVLEQSAVIRNELGDVVDAELFLISGYPNVEFGHVLSPMSPRTTWASFFSELNRRIAPPGSGGRGGVVAQQVMSNFAYAGGGDSGDVDVVPAGEGVDVYYHPIGRHSLKEGDSLMLPVAKGVAGYERIVEWMIPDTRTANGQLVDEWHRQQNPDEFQDSAWDAARFKNPYGFPMTTAPATVVSGGRFNGQRTVTWVNPGEETTVRINKALSLRTRSTEIEEPGERVEFWVCGMRCHKATVRGELEMTNHRQEAVKMVVRRRFSGELKEADAEPKTTLLEEGVTSVNVRNELVWTTELRPGETRKLGYRYVVNVPF